MANPEVLEAIKGVELHLAQLEASVNRKIEQEVGDLARMTAEQFHAQDERFAAQDARFARQDERFAAQDEHFAQQDERFTAQDVRFAAQDERFAQQDARFAIQDKRFDEIDQRFDRLEGRLDLHDDRFVIIGESLDQLQDGLHDVAVRLEGIDRRLVAVELNTQVTATVVAQHGYDIAQMKAHQ